jgi:hypothetical protein
MRIVLRQASFAGAVLAVIVVYGMALLALMREP